MKIVSITVTRNDGDVIETFVRHHLDLVDQMVIYVHRCADNTEEILRALISEGLPLELLSYEAVDGETKGVRQVGELGINRVAALFGRAMKQAIARYQPDFILPLDSDEFLGSAAASAREAIATLPANVVTTMPWRTYVPTQAGNDRERNVLRRVDHRRSHDDPRLSKALIPAALAARDEAIPSAGNHRLVDSRTGQSLPEAGSDQLWLAHFPIRSEQQLRTKILSGYLSLVASPVRGFLDGYHWKRLYPRCKDPKPMTSEELSDIALRYGWFEDQLPLPSLVRDPVATRSPEPRYPVRSPDPWTVLGDNAEHLAHEVHRLAKDRLALEEQVRAAMAAKSS